jgi:hypothetical protein
MENKPKSTFELLGGNGAPLSKKEGTVFDDKPAPIGPPGGLSRGIPPHLKKITQFLSGVVSNEALLLDLCLDRAVDIVKFNFDKRAAGSDLMQEISALHFVGAAAPLAIELYKQSLESIKDRADEYMKLVADAQEELKKREKSDPQILVP